MTQAPDYGRYPMVQTYVRLALSYKTKGRLADAFRRYEKALAICYMCGADPLMDDIRREMASLDIGADIQPDMRLRRSEIRQLLEIKNVSQAQDYDAMEKNLAEFVQAHSHDPEVYILLGTAALKEGKKEKAVQNFLAASKNCYEFRALKRAKQYCEQVLRLFPPQLEARRLLSDIYKKMGETSQASIQMLTLVREYLAQGRLGEALTYVQEAIELGNMEAHFIQGLILFHGGRLDEAKQKFNQFSKFNSRHEGALSYLARIYQKQNMYENAMKTVERLVSIHPKNPEMHLQLAEIQAKNGLLDDAVEHYRISARLYGDKGDQVKAGNIARMAAGLRKTEKAGEESPPKEIPVASPAPEILAAGRQQGDEAEFASVCSDERFSARELAEMYKKASAADAGNPDLESKLNALEKMARGSVVEKPVSDMQFFWPLNSVDISLLQPADRARAVEKLKYLSASDPGNKALVSKLAAL